MPENAIRRDGGGRSANVDGFAGSDDETKALAMQLALHANAPKQFLAHG